MKSNQTDMQTKQVKSPYEMTTAALPVLSKIHLI